jgi:hypothetical protein
MPKKVIVRVERISSVKFTEACLIISNEPAYDRISYLPLLKKKIQTHFLRPPLQKIAMRYLPYYEGKAKIYFPAELVIKIASIMDVYVTDLIRLYK